MTETIKDVQKALPYDYDGGWVAVQNAVLTVYTLHPDFKATTLLVYAYLLKNYNIGRRYSWPSFDAMEIDLNISRGTISAATQTLCDLGMINIFKRGSRGSHAYTFNVLIDDEVEFITRFPDAIPNYEKKLAKVERIDAKKAAFDKLIPVRGQDIELSQSDF
ncbi:hypothetical protein [Lysinibacillus pakistanensis]|uniref:Helix-turn-helix domain-containing protein n=1 Tax=Lysinibacillus pakistanensis TaxID=759811 RepID=A0AAX3X3M5_9BACI|nr:hypothetical protein [Lysinibacillus pakistanensis]MDM5233499.1 hypothetical protein [Lysinibacillus pakistanensis]WHY48971.1 hypothetical protein QNH22_12330 [Lysinibacillus pakistanensis]WHY53982.1 hypothetical protein QNH24_12310 [Lysinibacillus pakistanensis]